MPPWLSRIARAWYAEKLVSNKHEVPSSTLGGGLFFFCVPLLSGTGFGCQPASQLRPGGFFFFIKYFRNKKLVRYHI